MRVKAIATKLGDAMRAECGMDSSYAPEWQITVGMEYVVFSVGCVPDSDAYGKATLYRIVDDFERLIPVPACLFDIIDPKVSKYWLADYQGIYFSLKPKEFIDNPFLTEEILDREEAAVNLFQEIQDRFERE